jgi:hypothetical protein
MTDIALETIDVVTERYSDERYSEFVRMAEVRKLFKYPETKDTQELSFAAPSSKNAPSPMNIMDILGQEEAVPSTTSIVAVPSGNITSLDMENYDNIALLDTYVSVYGAQFVYQRNPSGFDVSTPRGTTAFNIETVNARFRILTEALPGVLSLSSSTTQSYSQVTTAGALHLEFLAELFGAFGFPATTLTQLDSILKTLVKTLSNLSFSWSESNASLNHLLAMYYFEDVHGLPGAKIPKIRLFNLRVAPRSWELAIGKSSIQKFDFNMNYSDFIFTMNSRQVASLRQQIQNFVTTATNQQFDTIQQRLAMNAVQA